jgi:hypothetical protein
MTKERQPLDKVSENGVPVTPAIGEPMLWDQVLVGLGLRLRAGSSST